MYCFLRLEDIGKQNNRRKIQTSKQKANVWNNLKLEQHRATLISTLEVFLNIDRRIITKFIFISMEIITHKYHYSLDNVDILLFSDQSPFHPTIFHHVQQPGFLI